MESYELQHNESFELTIRFFGSSKYMTISY